MINSNPCSRTVQSLFMDLSSREMMAPWLHQIRLKGLAKGLHSSKALDFSYITYRTQSICTQINCLILLGGLLLSYILNHPLKTKPNNNPVLYYKYQEIDVIVANHITTYHIR